MCEPAESKARRTASCRRSCSSLCLAIRSDINAASAAPANEATAVIIAVKTALPAFAIPEFAATTLAVMTADAVIVSPHLGFRFPITGWRCGHGP